MSTAQREGTEQSPRLQVFLCHASEDKSFVLGVYGRLEADGFAPWLDDEKILPGAEWEEEIKAAFRRCHVVIVFLSQKSVIKEGYFQREILIALNLADEKPERTIFIIPARIDQVDIPNRLSKYQSTDLFGSNGYERLVAALNQRAKSLGLSQSAPLPKRKRWLFAMPAMTLLVIAVVTQWYLQPDCSSSKLTADQMYEKGINYYNGQSVVQDVRRARCWFEAAASKNRDAMYMLGLLYDKGQGVRQDSLRALPWYQKAAELGESRAMTRLGEFYESAHDYHQALPWYCKAAKEGNSTAMRKLGQFHELGRGVRANPRQARFWYEKAATARDPDPEAIYDWGRCYQDGIGGARNPQRALSLYQQADELGNRDAKDRLREFPKYRPDQ